MATLYDWDKNYFAKKQNRNSKVIIERKNHDKIMDAKQTPSLPNEPIQHIFSGSEMDTMNFSPSPEPDFKDNENQTSALEKVVKTPKLKIMPTITQYDSSSDISIEQKKFGGENTTGIMIERKSQVKVTKTL